MYKYILVTILIATDALSVRAADFFGTVVNRQGEPLEAVSVVTDIRGVGTQTDADGQFNLRTVEEIRRVTFSSIGYQSLQYKADAIPSTVIMERAYYRGTDIIVHASRVEGGVAATALVNLSEDDIARDYTLSEFPLLLETTPNLHTFVDAGSSLGFASVRIRGLDDRRIVTYINGVPLNDPEDQNTYFVDLPDFAANITDVQVQRGVGNALYGDASFGGSINIVSKTIANERKTIITAGYGGYTADGELVSEMYKQSLEYSTGLIDGRWAFSGRFSKVKNDGYRYNSWYRGWSYYFSAARLDSRMTTELHLYGGPVKYHAAWYGSSRSDLANDRRINVGIPGYEDLTYDNATDNFNQPHYQLHNTYQLDDRTTLYNTLYYIRGKGYYEQFKPGQTFADYGIGPAATGVATTGDLVRQKWVHKNQTGWTTRIDREHRKGMHTFGGSLYYFESDHFGRVVWAQNITGSLDPRHKYYQHYGKKWVGSVHAQERFDLSEKLSAQLTTQLRYQHYSFEQQAMGPFVGHQFNIDWFFVSPRIGFRYTVDDRTSIFINFAVASRSPSDAAIYDADNPDPGALPILEIKSSTVSSGQTTYAFGDPLVKSERLYDFELGGEYRTEDYSFGANFYYMKFDNMITAEGGITDGITDVLNIDGVRFTGLEFTGALAIKKELRLSGNFSLTRNRITDFVQTLSYSFDSTDAGGGDISIDESVSTDLSGRKVSRFPGYLGNFIADYRTGPARFTWRSRFIGRQYADLQNVEEWSIDPVFVSSASVSLTQKNFLGEGAITISVRVDNLFDKKYESAVAYAENYAFRAPNEFATIDAWSTYYVASERSFFVMIRLEAM